MARGSQGLLVSEVRGKAGSAVIVRRKNGVVVYPRVVPQQPNTAPQQGMKSAMMRASEGWKSLSTAQATAWRTYAAMLPGERSAFQVFVGTVTKYLQVHPTASALPAAPTSIFFGDSIVITATGAAGVVNFMSVSGSRTNVVAELLVQRLAHANRAPKATAYRTQAFATLTASVPRPVNLPPGVYACAYRFVNSVTGQASGIAPCGIVTVS